MGFFDRFSSKKSDRRSSPSASPESAAVSTAGGVIPRLAAAREKLEAKDLPAAMAIYEEVLVAAGERADVLVAVSGDLGANGYVEQIIELVAPRYDAERHGPATGLNLLQAYLAVRNADAAQHVLDILFSLNRPDLEDRLHGFSNVIAELIQERHTPLDPGAEGNIPDVPKVALVSISKPIWFYGLEPMTGQLLPPKTGRVRRIAFGQLALPGYPNLSEAMLKPEDDLGRLSRALPLWLAETFYFSAAYSPIAVVGVMNRPALPSHAMLFGAEWTSDNLRQLVDTAGEGLDYVITGALRKVGDDYEVLLRVWEIKKLRERKTFTAKWTATTADTVLTQLHGEVCAFMEWSVACAALAYIPAMQPRIWLETLGASLGLFLVDKAILPREQLAGTAEALAQAAQRAAAGEVESLAFLTLRARAAKLGVVDAPAGVALAPSALVEQAAGLLA
jgi:hypothetical protein